MAEKRVIKRYTNRKLYDKLESRYVTLEEIARLVRGGEDVTVVDNETEEDLTAVTFAQIILEEEKRKTHVVSVPFLRNLIRSGEARMQDISDRAVRSIEALGDFTERAGERVREVVEGSGRALGDRLSALDDLFGLPQTRLETLRERARRSMDKLRSNPVVRRELERIAGSLHTIEEAISRLSEEDPQRGERKEHGSPAASSDPVTGRAGNGMNSPSRSDATEPATSGVGPRSAPSGVHGAPGGTKSTP
jgi:polyhydroxyalkanoate synthesis repressor PhaR